MRIEIFDQIETILKEKRHVPDSLKLKEQIRYSHNEAILGDNIFQRACALAGIPLTRRQASKWNNGYGKALQFRGAARRELVPDA